MVPIANPVNAKEENYNVSHKKTRHIVERCIGVLKSRFRCLCRQRVLMYSPQTAGKIINSCAVLHNVMLSKGYPLPPQCDIEDQIEDDHEDSDEDEDDLANLTQREIQQAGQRIRKELANRF